MATTTKHWQRQLELALADEGRLVCTVERACALARPELADVLRRRGDEAIRRFIEFRKIIEALASVAPAPGDDCCPYTTTEEVA